MSTLAFMAVDVSLVASGVPGQDDRIVALYDMGSIGALIVIELTSLLKEVYVMIIRMGGGGGGGISNSLQFLLCRP